MDFSKHSKEELDERALADTAVALNEWLFIELKLQNTLDVIDVELLLELV